MHDAAELDVETVDSYRRRIDDGGRVRFSRGDGYDLGLRIPVVADIVGHGHAAATAADGRGRVAHCCGAGGGCTATAVVVDAAAGTAIVTVRAAAASRVSGVHAAAAGDGGRGRQVANATIAAAAAVVAPPVRVVTVGHRGRLVQRFEFGGHAVVDDVEAHGRQRHAGQYVHRTEPHGRGAGDGHFQRPRVAAVADGAEQHEAEEHAVQIRLAAGLEPVKHGRAAPDVRGHEREPNQQQWHEAGAVRGRCGRRHLCRGHGRCRTRGRRRGRHGGRPVGHPLEYVFLVAGAHVIRF